MRLAYLDASAGISGDMFLGALLHAGVPVDLFHQTAVALAIGATLEVQETDRSGIHAVKVNVLDQGHPAEAHDHHHNHRRSLHEILALIDKAPLPPPVQLLAASAFELLGKAEAKIHHVPVESIHFHEVGAVDAIIDIVLAATGVHALKIEAWHCSPLNVGGGTVQCAHGRFPVPAPATAELLRGAPTYSSGFEMELVTPTGAALLRALDCQFGPAPQMTVETIGYGAGTRNPPGFANVLRLSLGESAASSANTDSVLVLETALDDLSPQVIGYVTERALALGALDVMCTPVQMKKNRPGVLLTILTDHAHRKIMEDLLFKETSTLGLRVREDQRVRLERKHIEVTTPWGAVRVKVGYREGIEFNAAPEFEECRRLAEEQNVPVKKVQEAARQAYRQLP